MIDAMAAAALLHLRRSIGTSAGLHLFHFRAKVQEARVRLGEKK